MNFTFTEVKNLLAAFGGDEDTEITVVEDEGVKKAFYTEYPEEGHIDITSGLIGGQEILNVDSVPEEAINIILDEKDPQSPIFVEIENDKGESINIGKRSAGSDGLTKLRISSVDLKGVSKDTANKDLLEYFKKEIREGKIDFGVRATEVETGIDFYIHPISASGETINFALIEKGDEVRLAVTNKTEWNTNPTEILINTIHHSIPTGTSELSYEDVVKLVGLKPDVNYSMTYQSPRKGDIHRQGIMAPGKIVRIENGMRFNVVYTG